MAGERIGRTARMALGAAMPVVICAAAVMLIAPLRRYALQATRPTRSVEQVQQTAGRSAEQRLRPAFDAASVPWPPGKIAVLAFKEERQLELWGERDGRWVFIRSWPILAASGHAGPKLAEGDCQVPEGIYRINLLNPNSRFHLSMQVDYPNAFDRRMAQRDGRTRLGGEIFIHGGAASIGCIAIGDGPIEELFCLVSRIGKENATVLISPRDGRRTALSPRSADPAWVADLYTQLAREIEPFRRP